MRLLGIDYGTKRVGLAIGDTETKLAVPYDTIAMAGSLLDCLMNIVRREKIEKLVVGAPKTLAGAEGQSYNLVQDFIRDIKPLNLEIVLEDERFTTKEIERIMNQYGKAKRGIKKDAAAAALILQSYLDRNSS